jgi:RHS repeat-associated protein
VSADPFGYQGQAGYYGDIETGLYLCTFRYYEPREGRWLNEDPIGYVGGVNLYGYCQANPANGADPRGLKVRVRVVYGRSVLGRIPWAPEHVWIEIYDDRTGKASEGYGLYPDLSLSNGGLLGLIGMPGVVRDEDEHLNGERSSYTDTTADPARVLATVKADMKKAVPYNIMAGGCYDYARDVIRRAGGKLGKSHK